MRSAASSRYASFQHKMFSVAVLVGVTVLLSTVSACSMPVGKLNAVLWVGGKYHDFEPAAAILAEALNEQIPIELDVVPDASFLDKSDAEQLDVILMHHCYPSDEGVLTEKQKQTLLELVRSGVGVVGIHASYYSFVEWDPYHELFGARFIKHGPVDNIVAVRTVDDQHAIMKDLVDCFELRSELYQSTPLAADCHVLARAKSRPMTEAEKREAKKKGGKKRRAKKQDGPEEHPSVWTRQYGKGRVVNILPGHAADAYRVVDFQKLIASSTLWAAGRR